MPEPVLVTRQGAVGVVTLNRPERRNAIDGPLLTGLREAMAALDEDPSVVAIVLTGAGPAFCAGMDLEALDDLMGRRDLIEPDECGTTAPWRRTATPVVGAVRGPAVTGGLEVALACDVLVGSPSARFADTHARVGIVPGWGLSVRLALAVGVREARAMGLTGAFLTAERALGLGLLHAVVPEEELLESAVALAAEIGKLEPATLRAYGALYDDLELEIVAGGYRSEARHVADHLATDYLPGTAREHRREVVERGRTRLDHP